MRNALVACLALVVAGVLWGCAPRVGPKEPPAPAPKVGQWGFVGGLTAKRPDTEVEKTNDKEIYLNERYSLTDYRITLPNGGYVVKLHFAETYPGIKAAGERVFSVAIEGKAVLTDFDVYQEAGGQRFCAVVKEFAVEVSDGELTISFYRSGLRLSLEGGQLARVEPWQPTPELRGSARFPDLTFLQLLLGYRSLEELKHAFADCATANDEARALLEILFPKRSSDVWPVS